jgi:hypothetical protein
LVIAHRPAVSQPQENSPGNPAADLSRESLSFITELMPSNVRISPYQIDFLNPINGFGGGLSRLAQLLKSGLQTQLSIGEIVATSPPLLLVIGAEADRVSHREATADRNPPRTASHHRRNVDSL